MKSCRIALKSQRLLNAPPGNKFATNASSTIGSPSTFKKNLHELCVAPKRCGFFTVVFCSAIGFSGLFRMNVIFPLLANCICRSVLRETRIFFSLSLLLIATSTSPMFKNFAKAATVGPFVPSWTIWIFSMDKPVTNQCRMVNDHDCNMANHLGVTMKEQTDILFAEFVRNAFQNNNTLFWWNLPICDQVVEPL